jgi:hypothetical protein
MANLTSLPTVTASRAGLFKCQENVKTKKPLDFTLKFLYNVHVSRE